MSQAHVVSHKAMVHATCHVRETNQRGTWELVLNKSYFTSRRDVEFQFPLPKMSSSSAGQRFADYFVVSGLDITTGLEADQLSGLWSIWPNTCEKLANVGFCTYMLCVSPTQAFGEKFSNIDKREEILGSIDLLFSIIMTG